MFAAFAVLALMAQSQSFVLESKVKTATGTYERFVDSSNERRFKVRWTRTNGSSEWIVDARNKTPEVVIRRPILGLMAAGYEDVIERNLRTGSERWLGRAKRIFKLSDGCSAVIFLGTPTVASPSWFQNMKNLNCDSTGHPQISNLSVAINTQDHPLTVECNLPFPGFCLWVSDSKTSEVNKGQLLSLTTLQRLEEFMRGARIKTALPTLNVEPWAMNTNNSQYDALTRTIYLGLGEYPDSHDGFVVAHEWAHFLIDELNPGLWGYDAEVFHEAIADFLSTDLWNNPCFAPYDAREQEGRDCLRRLNQQLKYPDDMVWSNPHLDSRVFSSALWEGLRGFSREVRWGILLETIISLPKNFEVDEFWSAVFSSLSRQSLLSSSRASAESLKKVLRDRGFLSQSIDPSHRD
jgi:hypothetical protein